MNAPESSRRPRRARRVLAHWATIVRRSPSEYEREVLRTAPVFNSAGVARLLAPRLGAEMAEVFYVVCLDGQNHVLALAEVARGGGHSVTVDYRVIFRLAVAYGANALIVAHNHPSGDPTPSAEDLTLTRRLREIGDVLGVPVVDHVIVAGERHYSFLDSGLLAAA